MLQPGQYLLTKTITNTRPDRRTRHDWRKAVRWAEGTRWLVTLQPQIGGGSALMLCPFNERFPSLHGVTLESLLYPDSSPCADMISHLIPCDDDLDTVLRVGDERAIDVLQELVAFGALGLDQVRAAIERIKARDEAA